MEVIERLNMKVNKSESCWLWTAATDRCGYGSFWFDGQMRLAHRVNWELLNGPVPDGLELDHLCMNRACVNPDHLELVTHRENVTRSKARITACPKGHQYSGENLRINSRGHRKCMTCHRATSNQARNNRHKELTSGN